MDAPRSSVNERKTERFRFVPAECTHNVIMILCFHEDNNFSLTRAQYNIVILLLLLYPRVRAETAASRYASGCLKQYFFIFARVVVVVIIIIIIIWCY